MSAVFFLFFAIAFAAQLWANSPPPAIQAASRAGPHPAGGSDLPGYPAIALVPRGSSPLVLASAAAFLEVGYYAEDSLAARLYYVTDPDTALRRTGSSGLDLLLARMPGLVPVRGHIQAAGPFLKEHRQFMLYYSGQFTEWLVPELLARNWNLRVVARQGAAEIVEATAPPDAASSAIR